MNRKWLALSHSAIVLVHHSVWNFGSTIPQIGSQKSCTANIEPDVYWQRINIISALLVSCVRISTASATNIDNCRNTGVFEWAMTTVSIWTKLWYCGNQSDCISIEVHLNGKLRDMEFIVYVLQQHLRPVPHTSDSYFESSFSHSAMSMLSKWWRISIDFTRSKADSQTIFTVNQSRFDQFQLQIQICHRPNWTRTTTTNNRHIHIVINMLFDQN